MSGYNDNTCSGGAMTPEEVQQRMNTIRAGVHGKHDISYIPGNEQHNAQKAIEALLTRPSAASDAFTGDAKRKLEALHDQVIASAVAPQNLPHQAGKKMERC